jgi:DNA-damage-inducible protein J
MGNKSAIVTARVEPEVKKQAEDILAKLGLLVSVAIDTLYRQIILKGGLPYSISDVKLQTLDNMSKNDFLM